MPPENQGNLQTAYARVCESYQAVDDFRMKLLGLLPVATGTGVFLLLNSNADLLDVNTSDTQQNTLEWFLAATGVFGTAFTLGLFALELFGIKKCHYLIRAGQRLEVRLDVRGQFRSRPRSLIGLVNEPFASALIYPSSMAAWAFLAVAFSSGPWRWGLPAAIFLGGFVFTLGLAEGIKRTELRRFRAEMLEQVAGLSTATVAQTSHLLDAEDEMVRRSLARLSSTPAGDGGRGRLCAAYVGLLKQLPRKGQRMAVRADEAPERALATLQEHCLPWSTVIGLVPAGARERRFRWCRVHPRWEAIVGTVGIGALKDASDAATPKNVEDLLPAGALMRVTPRGRRRTAPGVSAARPTTGSVPRSRGPSTIVL